MDIKVDKGFLLALIELLGNEKLRGNEVIILHLQFSEVAVQRRSYKNVFWKYAADLQESTHAEVWFQ